MRMDGETMPVRRRNSPALPLTAALAALALTAGCATAAAPPPGAAAKGALLPDRLLTCSLGHATNVDFTKDQKTSDMVFDTHHAFSLFLPAIPRRTTPPPDATEPAEPVDKRTRVVSDPTGLVRNMQPGFVRVIDLWPERVEITGKVDDSISKLMILSDIDEQAHTANLFMTEALDLATFDPQGIYIGTCTYTISSPPSDQKPGAHKHTRSGTPG